MCLYRRVRMGFCSALIFLGSFLSAQPETYKWYFGQYAALDFSNGSPVSVGSSTMLAWEGCASVADSAGNLLFYTNGDNVWNRNHQVMANGSQIGGNISTTQSSLIVKKPGSNSHYILFALNAEGWGTLNYSVIDMSLASGDGSVTVKTQTLATQMTEKLHGTPHCDGAGYWIVGRKLNSGEFLAFRVTAGGVNSMPVISYVGASGSESYFGQMKFNSTGTKLATVESNLDTVPHHSYTELFDFDNSTGVVAVGMTLDSTINTGIGNYGCEFSPDGTKLYVTMPIAASPGAYIKQWDLCAGSDSAIRNSRYEFFVPQRNIHGLQLASDKKIYASDRSSPLINPDNYVSVIASPNEAGPGCNFINGAISLTTGKAVWGLPNFLSSLFRQKPSFSVTPGQCGNRSFSISPALPCQAVTGPVNGIEWWFGDSLSGSAQTSSLTSPQHQFGANGTYTVTLRVHYPCYTDSVQQVVQVTELPPLEVSHQATICAGETATITATGGNTYLWNGIPGGDTFTVNPSATAHFTVTASDGAGCSVSRKITVQVLPCTATGKELLPVTKIFPNPSGGLFRFETASFSEIQVADQLGKTVFTGTLQPGGSTIDLSGLPDGVYFAEISHPEGKQVIKLHKQREL